MLNHTHTLNPLIPYFWDASITPTRAIFASPDYLDLLNSYVLNQGSCTIFARWVVLSCGATMKITTTTVSTSASLWPQFYFRIVNKFSTPQAYLGPGWHPPDCSDAWSKYLAAWLQSRWRQKRPGPMTWHTWNNRHGWNHSSDFSENRG